MLLDLSPGRQCVFQERIVEIDGPLSSSRVSARDVATGDFLDIAVGDLRPVRARTPTTSVDARFVPKEKWEKALVLAKAFATVGEGGALRQDDAVRLARGVGMSVRSVRRGFRRYQDGQRTSALVPSRGGRSQGVRLCAPDVETVMSDCIQTHIGPTLSKGEISRITALCERWGWPTAQQAVASHAARIEQELQELRLPD